jgi:phosphoglycolate phosphatase
MGKLSINNQEYEIEGILFDKDGTLLEFGSLWINWTKKFIDLIYQTSEIDCDKDTLARSLGFSYKNESWDPKGPLAIGSLQDIISILSKELYEVGIPWNEAFKIVTESYEKLDNEFDWRSSVKPVNGLVDFLEKASKQSVKMGVITSDNYDRAVNQLKVLGIEHYFSVILGHDSVHKGKPFTEMVEKACKELSINPEKTIIIGDSNGDMLLGKNSNSLSSIGIVSRKDQLSDHLINADQIIRDYTREFIIID